MSNWTIGRRVFVLTLLPIIAMIAFAIPLIQSKWVDLKTARHVVSNVKLMAQLSDIMTNLQKERGMSAVFLAGGASKADIEKLRSATNKSVGILPEVVKKAAISDNIKQKLFDALDELKNLRKMVNSHQSVDKVFAGYTALIDNIIKIDKEIASQKSIGGIGANLETSILLEIAKENLGRFRGRGSSFVASKKIPTDEQLNFLVSSWGTFKASVNSPILTMPSDVRDRFVSMKNSALWKKGETIFLKIVRSSYEGLEAKKVFKVYTEIIGDLNTIISLMRDHLAKTSENIASDAKNGMIMTFVILLISVVLIVALSVATSRTLISRLNEVTEVFEQTTDKIDRASQEISEAGTNLADGASQQAASIEQTASALEEMASMAKQNSENARQANNLVLQTATVVKEANEAVNSLVKAMEEITKASEETGNIVKTIDEIAFQTNLLALNAAVEAARAGEAGAGFAVVADEVRTLAMRSAEAAKNTSQLIENTIKKVYEGREYVKTTETAFGKVDESTRKIQELMGEISVASQEQADGVDQINKAVSEIDSVVQQNASYAEELASSAEDLRSQMELLKDNLASLVAMVRKVG